MNITLKKRAFPSLLVKWFSIFCLDKLAQINIIHLPATPKVPDGEKIMDKALKVSNTATLKKLSFYQFPSSLWTYFLKGKTPSVIPLWRPFLMPMKGARSKVPRSGHFRWLSQCQDWFTKSGGHERSLKLETWNFAWDLISPIHMLCKNIGLIWEHFEKMVQPIVYVCGLFCFTFVITRSFAQFGTFTTSSF